MKMLAIETATPASSVALADGEELVASANRVDRRGHIGAAVRGQGLEIGVGGRGGGVGFHGEAGKRSGLRPDVAGTAFVMHGRWV